MIGLGTNVLLRLLLDDDPAQVARARALLAELGAAGEAAYVPAGVVLEVVWVLARWWWEAGAGDVAEYLFRAQAVAAGATTPATFDRAVAGEPGFRSV